MVINFRDLVSGFFWLAVSFFVCMMSIPIGIGTLHSPGPGFLNFWAGVALGIFSISLIFTSILEGKGGEISNLWKGMEWHKVILVSVSLFIYAILLPKLGYLIATAALLTLLFSIMRRQRPWIQIASAVVTTSVSYLIFYVWLEVQLPRGIFGF